MNDDEFLRLLTEHERLLYSVCFTFAHGNREAMQDLYQEIMYNLWRTRGNYRGDCSPKNWFYRVALNTAVSLWRKESKRPVTIPLPVEMEQWLAEEQGGIYDELYVLIGRLPRVDQVLIFLYLDGASEQDMAESMGIKPSTVGVRIHRIKQKLIGLKTIDN